MGETLLLALRVSLSLAVVLALLWFLARRVGGRTDPGRRVPITVLGRQSLGRRSGVVVVEVGGRALLLGVSDNTVRLLSEVDTATDADDAATTAADDGADSARTGARAGVRSAGGEPAALTAGEDFAAVLDAAARRAAQAAPPPPPPPPPGVPRWSELSSHHRAAHPANARHRARRRAAPGGALTGSVLAPSTWSRTWAVLQERSGK